MDASPPDGHSPSVTAIHEGMVIDSVDPQTMAAALDLAFDYRGDVTLVLRDGRRVEGYIFDRRRGSTPPQIRMLPRDGTERITIADSEIRRLEVTGRDTAAGKTFENWVRRFVEKKLAGERASIESESLDGE